MQVSAVSPAMQQKSAAVPGSGPRALTAQEQAEVRRLQARDREVRAHEQAHQAAGGSLVSGAASFSYTTGPDGRRYATGGEVNVDTSEGRTPEETIRRAQQIRRAALAPARPSAQDRSVAAQAAQMEARARQELNQQQNQRPYASSAQPGQLLSIHS